MFHLLSRLFQRKKASASGGSLPEFSLKLSKRVVENLSTIQDMLQSPSDLIVRQFHVGKSKHLCGIACIDGLVDKSVINDTIMQNVMLGVAQADKDAPPFVTADKLLDRLHTDIIPVDDIAVATSWDDIMLAVFNGDTALFVDGTSRVLLIGTRGWASRGVEEPQTEALVRGPRDGFTENIRTNTVHLRRRIRDPNLRLDSMHVGRRGKRQVIIAYMAGITAPDLVDEVKRRIDSIDIDDVEGSGYVEQWIMDSFLTPFPLIQTTERPDKCSAAILGGRVAILVDGDPFALIAPITLASMFQSPEDYYSHWLIATFLRVLRLASAFAATFLPALYIALVEYHQGMIPSKLAFSIAGTREGVPFPAVIEAFIMEGTLEILREAGIRLPKPIGQTIGIVGGLVIGEAAVSAGIVSPIMVIVVAITAISSFALPSYAFAITLRIIRFGIMLAASLFGLYGIILSYIMINIHIVNLKSFGIPYSTPFSPTFIKDWVDLIWRAPVTLLGRRPQMMQTTDETRIRKK
ncbi:spore germination protein [Paenibacillus flagellatus]|uniref:Spore germination protein n=1 Tax=Paenibacillus flagellatus TaxID=2211139 RepID=A0A2V5KBE5_9BACL|nr:spore germination protein [Paenibacillus flagellatus]PYI51210.1 spore germination protein [Paenibacillus flagellatus]